MPDVHEYAEILDRLEGYHGAHLDLAGAYLRAGQPGEAEPHIHLALEKGYPLRGLAHNYLAIVAAHGGDLAGLRDHLQRAALAYPHAVVIRNINRFQSWIAAGGPGHGIPLKLLAENDFEGNMVPRQPELPARLGLPIGGGKQGLSATNGFVS